MGRLDWKELQARFAAAHASTGIKPTEWCEQQGLNYRSAKRYITIANAQKQIANSQKKTAKQTANSQSQKPQKDKPDVSSSVQKNLPDNPVMSSDSHLLEPDEFGLSEQQEIFVREYMRTKNRVEAYRLAGYKCTGSSIYPAASQIYRNIKVSRAIRTLTDRMGKRYAAELEQIVNQLAAIAHADPNDLAQYRRVNCRYCWGENHFYQWRDIEEFDKESEKAAKDGKAVPEYGGLGFVDNSDPNPDCPKCNGEGRGQVFIADTRDLDGPARWLYAGVKETKFGIEVQTANQEAARRALIQLLATSAGGGGDKSQAVGYTPDDYQRAAQQLDDEFGDLD